MRDEILYFLHIPKTAGGTLIYILDNYFHQSEIFSPLLLSDLLKTPRLLQEINRYRFLRGHFDYAICSLLERPLKIITMLRDPLERTISQFEHSRRHNDIAYWDTQNLITRSSDLETFLNTAEAEEFLGNVQTRSFTPEWFGIPKLTLWDVIAPQPSKDFLIELAKKRLDGCLFVGLQERFDDSVRLLAFTLKLRLPEQVTNYNVAGRRLKLTEISSTAQERLNALNTLDFQLYEYARTIFETRFTEMRSYLDRQYPDRPLDAQIELDYQVHNRQNLNMLTPPLRYTFDQPLIGTNWHLREPFSDGYARWTGPGNIATIEYPLYSHRDVTIEIATTGAVTMEVLESFRFQVDETPIPLLHSMGEHGPVFTGVIPAKALSASQPHILKLIVDKTIDLREIDSEMVIERRLGIRILYIDFK